MPATEAAGDESGDTWMTVTWVLLPGTVIDALLGWARPAAAIPVVRSRRRT